MLQLIIVWHWNGYNKCNTYLYILSRIKLYLSTENRKHIYSPSFWFCCVILGNCTHYLEEKLVKKLVRLQKRAARVILDCDFYTPSSTLFSDLKWMSFLERVIYMKAIQMFKTIRGDAPEYLMSSFTFAIFMQECYVHHLISKCILQNLIQKCIEINLYFQVHPFGTPFLHIFIIQIQFNMLKPSIYVG